MVHSLEEAEEEGELQVNREGEVEVVVAVVLHQGVAEGAEVVVGVAVLHQGAAVGVEVGVAAVLLCYPAEGEEAEVLRGPAGEVEGAEGAVADVAPQLSGSVQWHLG